MGNYAFDPANGAEFYYAKWVEAEAALAKLKDRESYWHKRNDEVVDTARNLQAKLAAAEEREKHGWEERGTYECMWADESRKRQTAEERVRELQEERDWMYEWFDNLYPRDMDRCLEQFRARLTTPEEDR